MFVTGDLLAPAHDSAFGNYTTFEQSLSHTYQLVLVLENTPQHLNLLLLQQQEVYSSSPKIPLAAANSSTNRMHLLALALSGG
jgi:hypothetical protein